MTDRINMLTVVLEQDTREENCESLMEAIRQMRGVLSVELNVADVDDHIAYSRARRELEEKLWKALSKD